jgi:hypothetical protein
MSKVWSYFVDVSWSNGFSDPSDHQTFVGEAIWPNDNLSPGVKNPDWRRRIRSLSNATSGLVRSWTRIHTSNGAVVYSARNNSNGVIATVSVSGDLLSWLLPVLGVESLDLDDNAVDETRSRMKRKFINVTSQWRSGTFFGQFEKTVQQFRHPAQGMRDLLAGRLAKLARRKYRNARDFLTAAEDSYLELQFGWKPFARDMADASKALSNVRSDEAERCSASTDNVGAPPSSTSISTVNLPGTHIYFDYYMRGESRKIRQRLSGAAKAVLPHSVGGITSDAGLLPQEFLPTLWQITPWSFVVDYFTNVGNIIDSVSWWNTGQVYCSESFLSEIDESISATLRTDLFNSSWSGYTPLFCTGSLGGWKRNEIVYSRSDFSLDGWFPRLHFNLPNLRQDLNLSALEKQERQLLSRFR